MTCVISNFDCQIELGTKSGPIRHNFAMYFKTVVCKVQAQKSGIGRLIIAHRIMRTTSRIFR